MPAHVPVLYETKLGQVVARYKLFHSKKKEEGEERKAYRAPHEEPEGKQQRVGFAKLVSLQLPSGEKLYGKEAEEKAMELNVPTMLEAFSTVYKSKRSK